MCGSCHSFPVQMAPAQEKAKPGCGGRRRTAPQRQQACISPVLREIMLLSVCSHTFNSVFSVTKTNICQGSVMVMMPKHNYCFNCSSQRCHFPTVTIVYFFHVVVSDEGWGDNCKLDVLYFLANRQTVTKLIFVFCCCYSYVSLYIMLCMCFIEEEIHIRVKCYI